MAVLDTVATLQAVLAAEHAAVYGYGVLGARVEGAARDDATACWTLHKAARDQLETLLTGLQTTPVAADPAYPLPVQPTSAGAAGRLAQALEAATVSRYAPLAGAPTAALRTFAAKSMQAAMARQVRWGAAGPGSAFPGMAAATLRPAAE